MSGERADAQRLRIAYVAADYPLPEGPGIGGIGAHTRALAHAVADLGHEVHVIAEAADRPRQLVDGNVAVDALAHPAGRNWKLGRLLPVGWLRRAGAVNRALRRLNERAPLDLVSFPDGYGEGFAHSFAPVAPSAVQLFGPASVVQRWDSRAVPPLRARAESWIERRPAQQAAVVVCATHRFAEAMAREWSLDAARMRIIRNPLDLERFRPDPVRSEPSSPSVLFAGHLQRLKGLTTLCEAIPRVLREHPEVRFVLVGNDTASAPGGASMRAHLEGMLRASGASGQVRFLAPVPQVELAALYRSSSLFVLPSYNDVYPNAVLEAMASGSPCVVTRNVGAGELIADADAGRVVAPDDAAALASAIGELLALPAEARRAMGLRGRASVEANCAAPVIARQTVTAYREVLASRERADILAHGRS